MFHGEEESLRFLTKTKTSLHSYQTNCMSPNNLYQVVQIGSTFILILICIRLTYVLYRNLYVKNSSYSYTAPDRKVATTSILTGIFLLINYITICAVCGSVTFGAPTSMCTYADIDYISWIEEKELITSNIGTLKDGALSKFNWD